MAFWVEERASDSPYVDTIMHGWTVGDGATVRPATSHWHMVLVKYRGMVRQLVVGPLSSAGPLDYVDDAELLWIRFKLGTFMPHLPTRDFLNCETPLPGAASQSFWLKGSAWQFPDYGNADSFIHRLVRDEILVHDPVVNAALQDQLPDVASRTVRHRFLQATGLTQTYIRQMRRAEQANMLLQQGVPILDTVHELGYFDQPHLTRSLKQFIGYTPGQILRMNTPA